jgi:membrane associated rhomboid family serine protease
MGIYDREYTQEHYQPSFGRSGYVHMRIGRTSMVVYLLIINVVVFLACVFFKSLGTFIYQWFQLDASSLTRELQLWRLVTYQFLHDPSTILHIFFNMYVLYFFGRILEPHLGPRRFLVFYLCCGITGGLFYLLLAAVGFLPPLPMVGASGAILGIIGACAVLFPQIKMIIFPIFIPISIRAAAIGGAVFYTFIILMRAGNAGGQAAHLAGMAAGALYAAWPNISMRYNFRLRTSPWHKKTQDQEQLTAQVDRILEKVYSRGISSLTRKEKRILRKATQLHQEMKK